jgi:hypothetical protein
MAYTRENLEVMAMGLQSPLIVSSAPLALEPADARATGVSDENHWTMKSGSGWSTRLRALPPEVSSMSSRLCSAIALRKPVSLRTDADPSSVDQRAL